MTQQNSVEDHPIRLGRDKSFSLIGGRSRKIGLGIALLILAFIVGGAASGEISPDRGQGALIVAVVLFVAAMLAVAFAMIDGQSTSWKKKK